MKPKTSPLSSLFLLNTVKEERGKKVEGTEDNKSKREKQLSSVVRNASNFKTSVSLFP